MIQPSVFRSGTAEAVRQSEAVQFTLFSMTSRFSAGWDGHGTEIHAGGSLAGKELDARLVNGIV